MSLSVQPASAPPAKGRYGERIASLAPWFHNIHLPGDQQTAPNHPLGDFPASMWEQIASHLPDDLAGATVLDIGCNAGFYSIQMARRGGQVWAIDHDPHYLRQAQWAAEVCGVADRIDCRQMSVYDLARPANGQPQRFDIVLFLGVLYHLRYPLLGLDLAAGRAEDLLVFQTLTYPDGEPGKTPADLAIDQRERMAEPGWPRMAFIEHSLASDPTNWWAPSDACCRAMLRSAGLEILKRPAREIYLCRQGLSRRRDEASLGAAAIG